MADAIVQIPSDLATQLPADPAEQRQVLELGLREWKVRKALDAYRQGQGSLAHAAERAGVSLREMVPLAYAYGLEPPADSRHLDGPLSLEQASRL
ncbi:MAG: hypothetical protein MI919_05000 [Holophagales bacterium]|nr:hypothetical protein [Holophagales bacterium]